MFANLGKKIDIILKWVFSFDGNDVQILIWGGFIGALLVFIIEFLRRPNIKIEFLPYSEIFNLPDIENIENKVGLNSKNYKIKTTYKKSFLNKILFKYSINNLKVRITIKNDLRCFEFQAKPDSNQNVYSERDVPFALSSINLTKDDSDTFPFINYSEENGWLLFEVWSIFQSKKERKKYIISDGKYLMEIKITSDQLFKKCKKYLIISGEELKFLE